MPVTTPAQSQTTSDSGKGGQMVKHRPSRRGHWGMMPWEMDLWNQPSWTQPMAMMHAMERAMQQPMMDFGMDRQTAEVVNDEHKFAVKLDVSQYQPEELEVTSNENEITITGKHEERQDDHGYVSRHFVRRYTLPEGTNAEQVASGLTRDGFLTIEAPKTTAGGPRKIPIKMN